MDTNNHEETLSVGRSTENDRHLNPVTIINDRDAYSSDSEAEYEEAFSHPVLNRQTIHDGMVRNNDQSPTASPRRRDIPYCDIDSVTYLNGSKFSPHHLQSQMHHTLGSQGHGEMDLPPPDDVLMEGFGHEDMEAVYCFPMLDEAKEHAGQFVKRVWHAGWRATHFYSLPDWLQDNNYIHKGYRPPLPSVSACFRSIFRIHSETGNIWSHMLGCVAFVGVALFFVCQPESIVQWEEKLVFSAFFIGAISCLFLSFTFHTMTCHSEKLGKIFCKLDFCGIVMQIVGSFIPYLWYGFYCRFWPKLLYILLIFVLGIFALVVSVWDKFNTPRRRAIRACTFISLGLSGVIPCVHYIVTDGIYSVFYDGSLGWLLLMAFFYIFGAGLYAWRIPERFFPGRCDIWFQSHQIFHLFVVVAAFIHYHGITSMAMVRLSSGSCVEQQLLKQLVPVVITTTHHA